MSRLATAWVGLAVAAVHLVGIDPGLVGAWADDAIYLDMGRSLAEGGPVVASILPGGPEVAKYPLGFPALIAALRLLGGDVGALLVLNVVLWGLAAQLLVDGILPRLGATVGERVAVGLLLAVNTVTLQTIPTALSEPLFTLALTGGLAAALTGRLPWVAGCAAVLGLTRSVGAPVLVAGIAVALLAKERRLAGALAVGWVVQAVVSVFQRAAVGEPDADTLAALHYYVDYGEHTRFYTAPLRAGELASFTERLAGVLSANLATGARSLSGLVYPADYVGGEGVPALGVGLLALAVAGAVRAPPLRPVLAVVGAYVAIFTLWTWPFSVRFWTPVVPLILAAAGMGLARLGNVGRLLVGPVVGLMLVGNAFVPFYKAKGRLVRSAVSEEDSALDLGITWLAERVGRDDVLVGDLGAFWLARRLGTHAVELEAMLPADDHLSLVLGLAGWDVQRHAGDLAEALAAVGRLAKGGEVYVVYAEWKVAEVAPVLARLEAAGVLRAEGQHGALQVWAVGAP